MSAEILYNSFATGSDVLGLSKAQDQCEERAQKEQSECKSKAMAK